MIEQVKIFICDDGIPEFEEFILSGKYQSHLESTDLRSLLRFPSWGNDSMLRDLVSMIMGSEQFEKGQLEILGFVHPEFLLKEVEKGNHPDIVVFDWQYGHHDPLLPKETLKELLEISPQAFVFVYSNMGAENRHDSSNWDEIPTILNKDEFREFSKRFQLFKKGISSLIFTPEEFIFQYILSRVSKSNTILIQGVAVKFEENGYLESSTDIHYLSRIFGRTQLLKLLEQNGQEVTSETIESMFDSLQSNLFFDNKSGFLISPEQQHLLSRLATKVEVTPLEALRRFGFKSILEVLDVGISKVQNNA